jgi:L-erythro-3,5-diaminohexanoate dehydrogenase
MGLPQDQGRHVTVELEVDLGERIGADRVLDPPGALPQPAARLDASAPVRPYEFEVSVERLCLDSTSHRNIRAQAGGDPEAMAARLMEIVAERGKMHNPETESGGVLLGTVEAVGERCASPPAVGDRIVTLASLTVTPLRLQAVTELDPESTQVGVTGTAYVFDRTAWAPVPEDLRLADALAIYDVCAAASQTRALAPVNGTVCVLGAGHAGRLALAAARDTIGEGTVVAVDVDPASIERVIAHGLCDIGVTADLRDPLAATEQVRAAGVPAADLTVVVVNTTGCEATALLLTADEGTALFFSMATSFQGAALAADGISSGARMVIGSGYSPDGGTYALDLVRRSEPLRRALGLPVEEPA